MSLFKTGHKDFPSLSNYTELVEIYGPTSSQAQSYLGRFLSDTNFVRQAETVRSMYVIKTASDSKDTKIS